MSPLLPIMTALSLQGGCGHAAAAGAAAVDTETAGLSVVEPVSSADDWKEWSKIPFFVRGKARRNTEKYAVAQGIDVITTETLYEATPHHGR